MKKISRFGITTIMLLMMTVFIGCGNEKKLADINTDEITSISVIFDDEEGITNTVTIDLEEKTKKTIVHGEESTETVEAIEIDEAFPEFIKDNVLQHIVEGEEDAGSRDTKRVVWRIKVLVGEESFQKNGFEEFPVYWDELLEYMCIGKNVMTDTEALKDVFPTLEGIESTEWEYELMSVEGRTPGPSDYSYRGIIVLDESSSKNYWDKYEWTEVTEQLEAKSVDLSEYANKTWYVSNEMKNNLMSPGYIGNVYFCENYIWFDVTTQ